jgi:hypothetical protein
VFSFGAQSAPYIFNLSAEVLHWILDCNLPALLWHYLDNFLQMFAPSNPLPLTQKALDWSLALRAWLGFNVQLTKVEGLTTGLEFLRLDLDTVAMEVHLPSNKPHQLAR